MANARIDETREAHHEQKSHGGRSFTGPRSLRWWWRRRRGSQRAPWAPWRRTGRGVEFESASGKGITDSGGNFIYRDGETVSFRIGALALGAAKPQDRRVSPLELVGTANTSDAGHPHAAHLAVARLDGDPENGIQISEAVRQTPPGTTAST